MVDSQEGFASAGGLRQQAWPVLYPDLRDRHLWSRRNPSAQIQNSHADGQTVADLIENDALRTIGDFAVDLDPAIDRAGMHDETIRLQHFCPLFGQPEQRPVFADAGEIFFALTLVLNAQQVYHVGVGKNMVDLVRNGHTEFFEFARDKGARSDQCDLCAQFR